MLLCEALIEAVEADVVTAAQLDGLHATVAELGAVPEEWGLAFILNSAEYFLGIARTKGQGWQAAREDAIAQLRLARERALRAPPQIRSPSAFD